MQWLNEMFGVSKPIIAMLHLGALPGDPAYDTASGMRKIVDDARRDLDALQSGGVDAVLISNEFSLPYLTKTEPITAIAMARVIGEIHDDIRVPYGANVLWDGIASIDLASATGASFVREIFTGVYASDFGMWDTNVGAAARHRRRVDATGVRLLFNVVPEATAYVADRDLASITRSTVFNARPDALVVSGLTAGAPTDSSALSTVKANAGDVPVFVNTGMRVDTAEQQLAIADGAVVGTAFKKDGIFENSADQKRVADLMAVVKDYRSSLAARPAAVTG
ncbi:BtpA/SgcQ family protein [Mycolicibacterium sp. YH-1]|uniref:BtpA/SgcQ family protein n=1 Tax=Mycolicibacterium sp. YH-1 TaxID=2908837 RepID=UPI001F4BD4CC|nr:BtpA/SgcQ family protein [Mycolicibacterium sp. YH-1]UNB49982.1 BtpA/SgcQ family protein [Mycolicibacterium sp. YH-1]